MTKQQLQEECQKQTISCENKSVDEMKALLLRNGMAAGAASALTTQASPSPGDAVRIQELELEKLRLQAEKEIELQKLRMQEEQRKEEAHRKDLEREEKLLERKEKMQQEQRKPDFEMLRLQAENSRKINVTPKTLCNTGGEDPPYILQILKSGIGRSGKKTKVVHVNMLKPYLERRMVLNVTRRGEGAEERDDNGVDVLADFSERAQWEGLVWPASVPVIDKERILSVLHRFEDVLGN
uniref:Uncharacterized protein n=1 Tax=Sphaerodactylus townsendi TaxID=933632 RepID=A0ACB8GEC4_9SAUR